MSTAATENWDREVDVIIMGAGAAGMTAAIVSKNEGLVPLVLEKTDQVGGTSAWSVGMMWFVDSAPMQAAGFKDSFDKARKYFAGTVGTSVDASLQEAYIREGREALNYMLRNSELEVVAVDYPDYHPELEGGMFGRAHAPLEFDARKLGPHFKTLLAPFPLLHEISPVVRPRNETLFALWRGSAELSPWHPARGRKRSHCSPVQNHPRSANRNLAEVVGHQANRR
jgi:hypothetical protein